MNKLLLALLVLSAPAVHAHHIGATSSLSTSTVACAAADPETQVGDGTVPGIVAVVADDATEVAAADPAPDVNDGTLPQ